MRSSNVVLMIAGLLWVWDDAQYAFAQENAADAADQAEATEPAGEDTDRGWRPGSTSTTSRQRLNTVSPQVTGSRPLGVLRLKIGEEYRSVSLTGRNFDRISTVFVGDAQGKEIPGYHVRISSRGRTETRLNLGVIAGPGAAPGRYGLVLRYETPDPRVSYRPEGSTLARRMIQRNILVPAGQIQVSAEAMKPSLVQQSPDPIHIAEPLVLRLTFAGVPGSEFVKVSPYYTPKECYMSGWSTIRKVVPCPEDPKRTTQSGDDPGRAAGEDIVPVLAGDTMVAGNAASGQDFVDESASSAVEAVSSAAPVAELDEPTNERASLPSVISYDFNRRICYSKPPPPTYEAEWVGRHRLLIRSTAAGVFPSCVGVGFIVETKNSRGQRFTTDLRPGVTYRARVERRSSSER